MIHKNVAVYIYQTATDVTVELALTHPQNIHNKSCCILTAHAPNLLEILNKMNHKIFTFDQHNIISCGPFRPAYGLAYCFLCNLYPAKKNTNK